MTRQLLYSLPGLNIGYFRCSNTQDSFEQICTIPSDQLVFPDYPVSILRQDARFHLASPGVVGWYQKGEQYRRRRVGQYDDIHTWISIDDSESLGFQIFGDEWRQSRLNTLTRSRYDFGSINAFLYAKMRTLRHLLQTAEVVDELEIEDRLTEILSQAYGACITAGNRLANPDQLGDDSLSESVKRLILDRLEDKMTLGQLSKHFGISQFKISRLFKAETGETVYGFRNRARLAMAVDLVIGTNLSGAEIAFRLGFSSPSHFGYAFRRQYGCTPTGVRGDPLFWALDQKKRPIGLH